jgi:CelD/BcsL family acetyltransferase involved in cellulose biosynthesis
MKDLVAPSTDCIVEFLSESAALASGDVRDRWVQAVEASENLRAALQTPQWARFRSRGSGTFRLAVIRRSNGELVGVCPLLLEQYELPLVGSRKPLKVRFKGLLLMGNHPLLPDDAAAYEALFTALATLEDVHAVYALNVSANSSFAAFLTRLADRKRSWFLHRSPPYPSCYLETDESFDAYTHRQFTAHERRNHARELRRLRERADGGEVELIRVTEQSQVRSFLESARAVAARSWQKLLIGRPIGDDEAAKLAVLEEMAADGFLRCYLLKCGGSVCAFNLGFQVNGVFHFHETAFDPEFARGSLSPGKVLLHLMLRDLFAHDKPRVVFFGPGDHAYKRWFTDKTTHEMTFLLLRDRLSNRTKIRTYKTVRSVIELARRPSRRSSGSGRSASV